MYWAGQGRGMAGGENSRVPLKADILSEDRFRLEACELVWRYEKLHFFPLG